MDYKSTLDENTFTVFAQLREIRWSIATEDSVPAYAVFTDKELAGIAALEEITEENMRKVPGIGVKKVEKYGVQMADLYKKQTKQKEE